MALTLVACRSDDTQLPTDDTQPSTPPEEDTVDPSKIIDIYLIAGQSNAVGHTKLIGTEYMGYLNNFVPELAKYAENMGKPELPSGGRQEYLEGVMNAIMFS